VNVFLQALRVRQLNRFQYDRGAVLSRVVRQLARRGAPSTHSTLWTDAIYGWGNRWAADEPYLAEVVRSAQRSTGPILECGSGLTTLLIGVVAARSGIELHSLEHDAAWHVRVSEAIRLYDTGRSTTVHLAPLRDFGDYDWYDAPVERMPRDFSLVVCDGPPEATRGGRSGMLPQMRKSLAPGCSMLLHDTNRTAERELILRWGRECGHTPEISKSKLGFARLAL
jgi:hypothetical protein